MFLTELERSAEQAWMSLLDQADLPATGWTLQQLSKRDDRHSARIVYRAVSSDGGSYIFKHQLRPTNNGSVKRQFDAHQLVFDSFPKSPEHRVPQPIYLDAETQSCLLSHLDGEPLAEPMLRAVDDLPAQMQLLKRAGAWLDDFHRANLDERRIFQPKFTLRHLRQLRAEIESGQREVPAKPLFLRGIAHMETIAPQYEGQQTVSCLQHGDFHMRNLIVSEQSIGGIDFSKTGAAPVGHDIAKFLLDYTRFMRPAEDIPPGQVVPPDAVEAFFDGYKLTGSDDPSLGFLLFSSLMSELKLVPKRRRDRSHGKQRFLEQLRPIARNAYVDTKTQNTPDVARFYLTKRSLTRAEDGDHEIVNAVSAVAQQAGMRVELLLNTAQAKESAARGQAYSLVHMEAPLNARGLSFRNCYGGPFWQIDKSGARWNWQIARQVFTPDETPRGDIDAFFAHWRQQLHGDIAVPSSKQGYIYMPLQGKLLSCRSFQCCSPVEMIETTLQQSNLPILATLHPNETYSQAELDAVSALQQQNSRFQLVEMPMAKALADCNLVVTQNSSAAFHAGFFGKASVLFAQIDFHHIVTNVADLGVAAAFDAAQCDLPDFAAYLHWYWHQAINIEASDSQIRICHRLRQFGWPV
ncbi:aminoglycoside phosphotransferase family protein [Parasedimentitalea psychrophila]|uniref:Aminoglycoside phosphotransferase family protein n=1 Tax=Parasedimentitalea psychrophila TaxID=2997337 RepID=A0A9Y2L2Q9_9RHOB|nr:aminoglycoside phosphotransferase family protein [Parasedimentitalea psychrophila]WIY26905.1 aminoglycoside phosphotransferase family protein [Parasedimentitalea psychrophila]